MKTSEKLIELADFLDNLSEARFDFNRWGYSLDNRYPDFNPSLSECGTVGCAAGWLDEASKGKCRAWQERSFSLGLAEAYLGLDRQLKCRPGERLRHSDFDRLFINSDEKLGHSNIPKDAVVARIRACAKAYAKRGR